MHVLFDFALSAEQLISLALLRQK